MAYHIPFNFCSLLHRKKALRNLWSPTKAQSRIIPASITCLFNQDFHSLTTPHKLWSTASFNMHEVTKAKIQLLFLSYQYPCGKRVRHIKSYNDLIACSRWLINRIFRVLKKYYWPLTKDILKIYCEMKISCHRKKETRFLLNNYSALLTLIPETG